MIAVVDDRDIGTIFEIGFFASKKLSQKDNLLITFTNKSFGLNVMIQQSVDAHLKGASDLTDLLLMSNYNNEMCGNQLSFFKNFNQDVF
jgi:nucleoside 2-deoxyribosyltransferase